MIRYTKDKWGCLVFPIATDIEKLQLDNCFIAKGDKSIWVFPFTMLDRYIQAYENFNTFLEHKENYYYLEGKISKHNYHYACKKKMLYVTGQCDAGRWTCSGFQISDKLNFHWHKAICQFISPVYADTQHRARRSIYFEELCPDLKTELENKLTLSKRGKRAGMSRAVKSKCYGCVYNKPNICVNRWKNADKNCYVSRKMMNRRVRKLASERFGSFENLVELFRYADVKNSTYYVFAPLDNKTFIVDSNTSPYGRNYERIPLKDIKSMFIPQVVTPQLEYKAKVYMLFLALLPLSNNSILDINNTKMQRSSFLINIYQGVRRYIVDYEFKTYDDILNQFGTHNKEILFKGVKHGKSRLC